jgi:hypothetical protein
VGRPVLRRENDNEMTLKEIRMDVMDVNEFRLGTCRTALKRATHFLVPQKFCSNMLL